MQIGLFGGTFNPIHNGHLQVAKEVKDGFPLDKIIFFPSAIPPHKKSDKIISASDRMEMLRIALSNTSGLTEMFEISDIEVKRSGPSYTIDTVNEYRLKMAEDNKLYLLMGIDAFFEIHTWKSYLDLFDLISFIVMPRPNDDINQNSDPLKDLHAFIKSNISDDYHYSSLDKKYTHPASMPIHIYEVTPIPISATMIRKYVKDNISIQSMVTPGVEEYIKSKGLYT